MIIKRGKILLGKRKNNHANGEYTLPGGHLELLETVKQCARREVMEECGLVIKNLKAQFVSNVIKYQPKHYVHIGLVAQWHKGKAQVLEPDKFYSWDWYSLDKLPSPLFEMTRLAIQSYHEGNWFFESRASKKAKRKTKAK